MSDNTPTPPGYWKNAKGDLIREANVPDRERDMDAVVRKIHGFGADLSATMWRFREYTMRDIALFCERIIQEYGGTPRGKKGNVSLTSFDGTMRVQLAIADVIDIGPEIQAAQNLIEECIDEWSKNAAINLRALVRQAFQADSCGRLSVAQLLNLRRIEIDDAKWRQAQAAITDALRPGGRAEYVRIYTRAAPTDPWQQMPLHLAQVRSPQEAGEATPDESLAMRVRSAVAEARYRGLKQGEIRQIVNEACGKPKAPEASETEA